jgi:hypothetical protein
MPDKMPGLPTQLAEIESKPFLQRTQLACVHELRRRIEANRGIKQHNLLAMYIPLGVDETQIEQQLLIDLNTLGAKRGDCAHKGYHAVTTLPDPREEKIFADRVLQSLMHFEVILRDILN